MYNVTPLDGSAGVLACIAANIKRQMCLSEKGVGGAVKDAESRCRCRMLKVWEDKCLAGANPPDEWHGSPRSFAPASTFLFLIAVLSRAMSKETKTHARIARTPCVRTVVG